MSLGAYLANIYTQSGLAMLAATCVYAWWKGGAPERLGTLVVVVCWIGGDLLRAISGELMPTAMLFIADAMFSFGLLVIAVRYGSLWLGAAMVIESLMFCLHGIEVGDNDPPRWHGMIVYLLLSNIISYSVLLILAGGTTATLLRRMQARKATAAAAAQAQSRVPQPLLAGSL